MIISEGVWLTCFVCYTSCLHFTKWL